MSELQNSPSGDFLLYKTEDGQTRIEVKFEGDTVWLSQKVLAELYNVSVSAINQHVKAIYEDEELSPEATIKKYLIVQNEGSRDVKRMVDHYNLDMILAIGYRVRSSRGVEFRRWATERLREYIIKGFTINDQQLMDEGGGRYFEELLQRIRNIRSSEKVFWRKVLDIYATSIDYDAKSDVSLQFFATVQNKMHWGAHGHTAAEIVFERADADKPNMGLTSWPGSAILSSDVTIAKNYLNSEELDVLNRIVTAYLEFAELQARSRQAMYMKDWIAKLDDFLKLSGRELLANAGKISHDRAAKHAKEEYQKFQHKQIEQPGRGEKDFEEAVKKLKAIPSMPQTKKGQAQ